jgi:hypothetical protein
MVRPSLVIACQAAIVQSDSPGRVAVRPGAGRSLWSWLRRGEVGSGALRRGPHVENHLARAEANGAAGVSASCVGGA